MIGLQTAARNVEADPAAAGVADWTDHVKSLGEGLLMNEIDSWMTGVNRDVEGKQTRKIKRLGCRWSRSRGRLVCR
jgi:hypothetical protein